MRKTDFSKVLAAYFTEHLTSTRGLTRNTIASYRDVFRLLLKYMSEEKGSAAEEIQLDILNRNTVIDFLNWLESERKACAVTRNQRLAALQAFFRYVQYRYPDKIDICQDILDIRSKRCSKTIVSYLNIEQLKSLLAQPDLRTSESRRDLTLMTLLYDSGARVQELIDLNVNGIRLEYPARVILTGKGSKSRQVPLMQSTCKLLENYLKEFHRFSDSDASPLFFNKRKERLSRSGITYILKKYADMAHPLISGKDISPHILRHSKAMHLLQAGVNLIYIRDFLGHVNVATTEVYARADDEMKRKAFEKAVPDFHFQEIMPWEEDEDLMKWLDKLGTKQY